MDRALQSGLEKRTRVGAWSSRVYRLERGYLSAWTDVSRVAAKEEPSRTECLFEGNQVAKLTDQGDRKFKLDFPWDSSRSLQLRASNLAMKKAWMDVLKATLKEVSAQIQGTGAVFAYGGAAHYEEDQAYEEATFLRTNRFMAVYVIDEENRMSYVHDVLNEGFHQAERSGSGRDIHRACEGANSAVEELLGLIRDFDEEMKGLEELQGSGSSARDAAVLAPKIRRFCEQHLKLVGRLVTSRLMLELSPFMDSSMVATSSGGVASPSRQELVATRRKLDEAYTVAEQHAVMGKRDWLMDIRGSLLDCEGLAAASSPTSNIEVTRSAEASGAAIQNGVSQMNLGSGLLSTRRANQDAPNVLSNVGVVENTGVGEVVQETVSQSSRRLVQSLFRRGSRFEKEQPLASSPQAVAVKGGQGKTSIKRSMNTEEPERSDLFGCSSKSPGESPLPKIDTVARSSVLPGSEEPVNTASTTSNSLSPQLQKAESGRKTRRAFAGGLWNRGGDSVLKDDRRVNHSYPREGATREETTTTTVVEQTSPPPVVNTVASASRSDVAAVKPSGSKRRFAGGVFAEPAAAASSKGAQRGTNGPSFAAAIQEIPAARDGERSSNPTAESVPTWATGGGNDTPSWATDSKANDLSSGSDGAHPDGYGVAPPSRADQGQQAAGTSPFMKAEAPAPAVRRPSQKPGESGRAKRAFGGGKSLF